MKDPLWFPETHPEPQDEEELAFLSIAGFPELTPDRRASIITWLESTVRLLKDKPALISDNFTASYKLFWED